MSFSITSIKINFFFLIFLLSINYSKSLYGKEVKLILEQYKLNREKLERRLATIKEAIFLQDKIIPEHIVDKSHKKIRSNKGFNLNGIPLILIQETKNHTLLIEDKRPHSLINNVIEEKKGKNDNRKILKITLVSLAGLIILLVGIKFFWQYKKNRKYEEMKKDTEKYMDNVLNNLKEDDELAYF